MTAPVFQAVVTALDHASPALATIRRNIKTRGTGSVAAPTVDVGYAFGAQRAGFA